MAIVDFFFNLGENVGDPKLGAADLVQSSM